MSLQVWLPLNGNLNNQGLSDITVTGTPAYGTGKIGNGLDLVNSEQIVISCPNLNNVSKFSICFWIKGSKDTNDTDWASPINFTTNKIGGTENTSFRFGKDNRSTTDGYPICMFNNSSYSITTTNSLSFSSADDWDKWIHICFTTDGTNVKAYENGVLKSSATNGTNGFLTGTIRLRAVRYNGFLNDFRIYDHCLSVKEVKELSKGLALHYKLSGIGGAANLIITNSNASSAGLSGWSKAGTDWANTLVDSSEASFRKAVRCTYSGTTQTSGGIHHPTGNTKGDLTDGAVYTLSARIRASKACRATFHNELQTIGNTINLTTEWRVYSFSSPIDNSKTYHSNTIYVQAADVEQNMWIECDWIKLEEGDKATPWIPNIADAMYDKYDFGNTTELDTSGYKNNGTKTNITCSSDSVKYSTSYVFNGSNAYVRTNDSLWKVDGSTELSINLWAYMDDWSTFSTRLYSCTEGGGYNVEPSGNNLSFSMSAYTNAEKSSYKYISDGGYCAIAKSSLTSGWHMFTYVYTTSGTKLYVNGDLKVNNTYTSYGVHYNMTAPLVIGAEATGSGVTSPYFNGKMSDFRLFYTALSADDVKELYQTSASIDNQGNLHTYEVIER